jgi:S1-C subfamily serine protease
VFLLNLASRSVGEGVVLTVTRGGQPQVVTVPLGSAEAEPAPPQPFAFSIERGIGARVDTAPDASGLDRGDVVTRAGALAAPTPAQLRRLLVEETQSGFLTLVVRRNGRQRIVAVPAGKGRDGSRP